MYVNLTSKMLFTVAPPVCVAKYSPTKLSDDGGEEEGTSFNFYFVITQIIVVKNWIKYKEVNELILLYGLSFF